ncbi:MAG: hypothetical protein NT062_16530, partial [Proteobacteria bacterium]|nr:hypothetical protein [Pseudomonadota bacterium]
SMRSRSDKVDVGRVCMTLGGGGHPGAGGCHLLGDLESTKDKVVRALDAAFNRHRPTGPSQIVQHQPPVDPTASDHRPAVIKAPSDEET